MAFTELEKLAFRTEFAPKATDSQWALFIQDCERRSLIPGKHVIFSTRSSQVWDAALGQKVDEKKVAFITTIEALRLLAERAHLYTGRGPFVFYYLDEHDLPSIQSQVPLGRIPHAVSVTGHRAGWTEPVFSVARYDAYVQTKSSGGKDVPTKMWVKRAEEQCAKCAEAAMLRTLAPEELGGLYIQEEMGEEEVKPEILVSSPAVVPQAVQIPTVNDAPALEVSPILTCGVTNTGAGHPGIPIVVSASAVQPSMLDFIESVMPTAEEAAETAAIQAAVVVEKPGAKKTETTKAADLYPPLPVPLPPPPPPPPQREDSLPSAAQMKDFYAKCKHISHDILPKTGITNGGDVLRAWLLRRSGKLVIKELTVGQWQSALTAIAAAGSEPAAILNLLKG